MLCMNVLIDMGTITVIVFVLGSTNEEEYSQGMRCGNFRLDLVDLFELVTEKVNSKCRDGLAGHRERLKKPINLFL